MPRGDKSKYTDKQKRKAEHIEEGYKHRGVPEEEAERRAWATVNKMDRGGEKPGGSGYGKPKNMAPGTQGRQARWTSVCGPAQGSAICISKEGSGNA